MLVFLQGREKVQLLERGHWSNTVGIEGKRIRNHRVERKRVKVCKTCKIRERKKERETMVVRSKKRYQCGQMHARERKRDGFGCRRRNEARVNWGLNALHSNSIRKSRKVPRYVS